MTIGTFGNLNLKPKPAKKKSHKANEDARYKCSGCGVKSDDEDVVISHVMTENECKATYFIDRI